MGRFIILFSRTFRQYIRINFSAEVGLSSPLIKVFRTETESKIRNEIERKMQDIQPNVEK
jgi:hypothetical protein